MKKIYLLILFLLIPQVVLAAPSATIDPGEREVEKGQTITATLKLEEVAAWNVNMTIRGSANCEKRYADVTENGKNSTQELTLSCKSVTEGTAYIEIVGDITNENAELKDISISTYVKVIKEKSNNNTLSDLKVDGKTIPGFSSSITSYTLDDYNGDSIIISATATDYHSTVAGTGTNNLKYGKNTFEINVIAENGSKKTYTIIVNRIDPRSDNNDLKSLSIDKGKLDFDVSKTTYVVELEHNVEEINIDAFPDDSKAIVTGDGVKKLHDYVNEFNIEVKAENQTTKTYTVKVIRKDKDGNGVKLSGDSSVKSITAKGYNLNFKPEVKSYDLKVNENVDEIYFDVITNDGNATYTIENNKDLKPGQNKIKIIITAENGDKNEYTINVNKASGNNEKEEQNTIAHETNHNNGKDDFRTWMIIIIVILLVICVGALVYILIKRKKTNNNQEESNKEDSKEIVTEPVENETAKEEVTELENKEVETETVVEEQEAKVEPEPEVAETNVAQETEVPETNVVQETEVQEVNVVPDPVPEVNVTPESKPLVEDDDKPMFPLKKEIEEQYKNENQ